MGAGEAVGFGGSTIGLTPNGAHVIITLTNAGGEGFQKSDVLNNCSTNQLYDGADIEFWVTYTLEAGQTYTGQQLDFDIDYLLTGDLDDPFNTATTTVNVLISTTGKNGDEQYTELFATMTGVSGAKLIGTACKRNNGSFTGDVGVYIANDERA